jgi:F0F1-type ATP synthase assembly protein I
MDDTEPASTEQQVTSSEDVSSAPPSDLTDELYTIERQSTDGWFNAEVTQIAPTAGGDQLAITVMLASGETATWKLEKPQVWTDEYLFVRLAEQYDYGAGAVDLLVGEKLPIRPDTGIAEAVLDTTRTWELRAPPQEPHDRTQSSPQYSRVETIGELLGNFIIGFIMIGVGIGLLLAMLQYILPGGMIEQVIYWGSLVAWILGSIGFAMGPDPESSTEESESESSE